MPKKNYYDLFGIDPSITTEQIWEKYERLKIVFYVKLPGFDDSKESRKNSERMFMTILGTLTG